MSYARNEKSVLKDITNQEAKMDMNKTAAIEQEVKKDTFTAFSDDELYYNGKIVFVIHKLDRHIFEKWVKEVAERSGQKVGWHWSGYDANIVALGDIEKVSETIKEMLPLLNQAKASHYKSAAANHFLFKPAEYTAKDVDYWKDFPVIHTTPCFN